MLLMALARKATIVAHDTVRVKVLWNLISRISRRIKIDFFCTCFGNGVHKLVCVLAVYLVHITPFNNYCTCNCVWFNQTVIDVANYHWH
jgi:hypothetical protein